MPGILELRGGGHRDGEDHERDPEQEEDIREQDVVAPGKWPSLFRPDGKRCCNHADATEGNGTGLERALHSGGVVVTHRQEYRYAHVAHDDRGYDQQSFLERQEVDEGHGYHFPCVFRSATCEGRFSISARCAKSGTRAFRRQSALSNTRNPCPGRM